MKNNSLPHKVYVEIRRKILSSQIAAGTRLKEDFWAQKVNVSRMAVREALMRLLGEQLVETGEKGGYFVRAMEKRDFAQIRELREIMEVGALRLAIPRITKAQIEMFEGICDDFTSMSKKGYYSGACEADIRFHEHLMECSGNEKLLHTYLNSHIPIFHQKLTAVPQTLNDYELTDKEHRAIVKGIKDKNASQAEKALLQHFARGANAILSMD